MWKQIFEEKVFSEHFWKHAFIVYSIQYYENVLNIFRTIYLGEQIFSKYFGENAIVIFDIQCSEKFLTVRFKYFKAKYFHNTILYFEYNIFNKTILK